MITFDLLRNGFLLMFKSPMVSITGHVQKKQNLIAQQTILVKTGIKNMHTL